MTSIRRFGESDARIVGVLIADTYSAINLSFVPAERLGLYLGPFRHARSDEPSHREGIAAAIRSATVLVAESEGEIVGVLRGRTERLASLFVRGDHQRRGIGRALVERFEAESRVQGVTVIRVAATVYGVPFYTALGYQRSTGMRQGTSFEGRGLPIQPMKKVL
ncbi:MAG: GNAT family N-acetyltransferase [Anaerolineae bacterium]